MPVIKQPTEITSETYELMEFGTDLCNSNTGEPVILVVPAFRKIGETARVPAPPFFLQVNAAQALIAQLSQQVQRLRAMQASSQESPSTPGSAMN